jgi:uncharacterized protein (TIGR02284 family)
MSRALLPTLNQLIRRGIADRDLYRQAVSAVREPGLRAVIGEIADSLETVIVDLQREVDRRGGRVALNGTVVGLTRRSLAEVFASVSRDPDAIYIRCLEQTEHRLLLAFERQAESPVDDDVSRVLARHLPRLRNIHLDVSSLAQAARS